MLRQGFILALSACTLALAGCETMVRHNDVLIFGTDTKLALDVSTSPANGGTPSVTVGYKRTEAVWMPLLANGPASDPKLKADACAGGAAGCPIKDLKYQGQGEQSAGEHGQDAYSVLASFGAKTSGSTSGGANGQFAVAQFFATGIAAQRLATNPSVTQALAVQAPEAAEAGANAAAAGATAKLTPEEQVAVDKATARAKVLDATATLLANCKSDDPHPFDSLGLSGARALPAQEDITAAKSEADFATILRRYPDAVTPLDQRMKSKCKEPA